MEGLRRPRVVSSGNAEDRQGTTPHPVSFSVRPFSAVGLQAFATGKGQLSNPVWIVDTHATRQMSVGSPHCQKPVVPWPFEASVQVRPLA